MPEKHTIFKKRRDPKHLKESLAVSRAHFPDEKGESVKSFTISDTLKDSAKWLAVDVSSGGKFVEHVYLLGLWYSVEAPNSTK